MPYWYGFRQIILSSPGKWVAAGPYESYAAAKASYDREKLHSDAQVSPPFQAENQTEADHFVQGTNPN